MNEMIERVARAIGGKLAPALSGGSPVTMETIARAAIEAMREPTDEMADAGDDLSVDFYAGWIPAALVFQTMIDRALK